MMSSTENGTSTLKSPVSIKYITLVVVETCPFKSGVDHHYLSGRTSSLQSRIAFSNQWIFVCEIFCQETAYFGFRHGAVIMK
jgi:hypothetical protein